MPTPALSRRRLLGGIALGTTSVVAGCSEESSDDTQNDSSNGADDTENGEDGEDMEDGEDGEDSMDGEDGADSEDGDDGELDLREANVVDVAFGQEGDSYTFDVTLHHDDDGEDGYANWWQVERLDGTRLGRRDLLHAHSRQPFTRSDTMTIPDEVACVVVRGHDQTHGYGGQAMVLDLDSGATVALDQGADRQSVDESDCP